MREQEYSKVFQRTVDASYRFGVFELHPHDRLVRKAGTVMPLPPKTFDALLYLVRHAGHLVTKSELIDHLWPSTYVTEANLTNIIGALRRTLGHEAITTVSRHGYRLSMAVEGEPGVRSETYRRFAHARELTLHRSLDSIRQAKDLYWICIAEDPGFAPAWAWLGRCCWFISKFRLDSRTDLELTSAAFDRAFSIDPDLACAHQFYTPVETDTGHARRALVRLRDRLTTHPDEAESLAGMVQVLRFCGLPDRSLQMAARVQELDPTLRTSVPHTLFVLSRYPETIDAYSGRTGYYLDAAAWAALDNKAYAAGLLRERLGNAELSQLLSGLMHSLLALLEGRNGDALCSLRTTHVEREPEVLFYMSRHYSYLGAADEAIATLQQAIASGFVPSPFVLRSDPWLQCARGHFGFDAVLSAAASAAEDAELLLREPESGNQGQ